MKQVHAVYVPQPRSHSLSLSVPIVVESCTESIEKFGMVDGIYRLSGIASNIRALK